MKKMKKGIAGLLCAGMLMGVIPMHVQAETRQISTVIEADGTIHTSGNYSDGESISTYYTVDRSGLYRRFDYTNTYILNVTCTDADAFEAEFSEQYGLYQLEENQYAVALTGLNQNLYMIGSGLTYGEAEAMVPSFLESSNVETVSIQYGYRIHENWMYETSDTVYVYSDSELNTESFDWATKMGYTLLELEDTGNCYEVKMSAPSDVEHWEGIYTFMLHCMDMPTVYAVNDFMIEKALYVGLQYETVATYNNAAESAGGDVNADGKVDITDAALILQHYAQHAASSIYAAAETDAMDVNGDGSIDIADATKVLEIYAQSAAGVTAS